MGDDGGDWTADVAEGPRHEAWQGTGVAGAVGDVVMVLSGGWSVGGE